MSTHQNDDELHHLLGAFVLGGLSGDEHRDFTRHLRHCETCQQESAQFSGLPSLLDLVDAEDVPAILTGVTGAAEFSDPVGPSSTPPALLDAVRAQRLRGRWRLVAAAAVLVVAAGGVGVALAPAISRLNEPPTSRIVARGPAGSATSVDIALVTRGWGTQVDLSGSDLPTSGVLYLEVTDLQGRSWDVASWSGTPSGRTTLTTACWVKAANIKMIQVHTREGQTVAAATT